MCPSVSSSIRSLPRYLMIALMDFDEIFRKVQFYGNLERDIFRFLKNCFFGQILGKKEQKTSKKITRHCLGKKLQIFSLAKYSQLFFSPKYNFDIFEKSAPFF